jgi:hypothetical protein
LQNSLWNRDQGSQADVASAKLPRSLVTRLGEKPWFTHSDGTGWYEDALSSKGAAGCSGASKKEVPMTAELFERIVRILGFSVP